SALAGAMAVLGDGAALATAGALAGVDDGTARSLSAELRRMGVLSGTDPVAFAQPLVRRSVYDNLSSAERGAAHATAGGVLARAGAPVEEVARHLGAVPPSGDAAAAGMLVDAGDQALARGSPDEAAHWFARALAEGAAHPAEAEILLRLGTSELVLRDPA